RGMGTRTGLDRNRTGGDSYDRNDTTSNGPRSQRDNERTGQPRHRQNDRNDRTAGERNPHNSNPDK
ncbi:MAG TPA: hypothetical protein P5572_18925, partial [Phycisphaerae bacterium]|nr:hypothetical protein [Phycisphaerae bacterium]